MKKSLFLALNLLASVVVAAPSDTAKDTNETKDTPSSPPAIDEHTRLVQQYMAERAKLVEARAASKTKIKDAKARNDKTSLKKAEQDVRQLETDFAAKNADLVRQIRAENDAKKPKRPNAAN